MENYFSTNLKYLREEHKDTQQSLADKINSSAKGKNDKIHPSSIGRWENNDRDLSVMNVIKISDVYNISMADLIGKDLRDKNSKLQENTELSLLKKALIEKGYMKDGEDYAPSILEDETFYKVQNLLKRNLKYISSNKPRPYTFSGLIKCGECGFNMTGCRGGHGKLQYYRCKRATNGSLCKNNKVLKEKELEKYIKDNTLKELEKQKLEVKNISPKVNIEKIDISKLKNKLNKLVELYTNELIDIDYYKKEYYNINEEIKKANEKNQTTQEFDISEIEKLLKSSFFEIYEKLEPLEKRRLLTTIIDNIEIKSGKVSAINFIKECTK